MKYLESPELQIGNIQFLFSSNLEIENVKTTLIYGILIFLDID